MNTFQSRYGYWVHKITLAAPIRKHEDADGSNVFHTQDVYTFQCTSDTEDGPKANAMSVYTQTRYLQEDGRTFTRQPGHWNSNFTLNRGRKLYRLLIEQGYSSDVELIAV